jgi:hypothetical protein
MPARRGELRATGGRGELLVAEVSRRERPESKGRNRQAGTESPGPEATGQEGA